MDKAKDGSADKMVRHLIRSGHDAMLEFADMHVVFVVDRGVSHEVVRHRLASFAHESTRYVNYEKKGHMNVVLPVWYDECLLGEYDESLLSDFDADNIPGRLNILETEKLWLLYMVRSEQAYKKLISLGETPQQARNVLPLALGGEINVKCNLREWRHIFNLRCSEKAHPQMVGIMKSLLKEAQASVPVVFDDLYEKFFPDEPVACPNCGSNMVWPLDDIEKENVTRLCCSECGFDWPVAGEAE
jgi:thymidylate synthase (FAD)